MRRFYVETKGAHAERLGTYCNECCYKDKSLGRYFEGTELHNRKISVRFFLEKRKNARIIIIIFFFQKIYCGVVRISLCVSWKYAEKFDVFAFWRAKEILRRSSLSIIAVAVAAPTGIVDGVGGIVAAVGSVFDGSVVFVVDYCKRKKTRWRKKKKTTKKRKKSRSSNDFDFDDDDFDHDA